MRIKLIFIILFLLFLVSCSGYNNPLNPSEQKTENKNTNSSVEENQNNKKPAAGLGQLIVHFINVGQGDSIFIETPSSKTILIDAGTSESSNEVVSYIKSLGFNKIDVVIGTHPHEDHIGGMSAVLKSFDTGSIYMPRKSTTTYTFKDLLNTIKDKGLKVKTAHGGISVDLDPEINMDFLAPNNSNYDDINNLSAVVKLTFKNTSFLFEGDAEKISETEMLRTGYNLKANVLKVGHHGSSSSSSQEFLNAVSPAYAIISLGIDNIYGHPHKTTLNKLKKAKIKVYRTDIDGTITAKSDGNSIEFDK